MSATVAIIVFALLIVGAAILFLSYKITKEGYKRTGKYPKGHYMSIGIAIGIPLGIPIGIALGNIALGPAMGLPIGVALGAALEEKHKDELRPLTEREQKIRKTAMLALGAFAVLGLVAFFAFAFLLG